MTEVVPEPARTATRSSSTCATASPARSSRCAATWCSWAPGTSRGCPSWCAASPANADLDEGSPHGAGRRYRVDLGEGVRGGLYLQGINEQTHGIADSLLSVLASRSQDIVTDLLERRSVAPAGRS